MLLASVLLAHARRLVSAAPNVRLTVTSALAHADMRTSVGSAADLLRFAAFVVRALAAARSAVVDDRS